MRLFLTEKLTIFIRTVTVIRRLRKLQKKLLWLTATRLKVGYSLNNFYGAEICSVFLFFRVTKTLSRVCLCPTSVSAVLPVEIEKLLYVILPSSPIWLVHRHTFINALPKNSCFLLSTFIFTVTLSPSYSLIQIDITVTASDGDCYMSNFRPRQCGLFIVILSSTLSLKTVHRTVLLTVAFKSRHRLLA